MLEFQGRRMYWRTERALRNWVCNYPALYIPLVRVTRSHALVDSETKLVIEGFPRSANSFAEAAVRWSQGESIALAHHTHAAAHVIKTVKQAIPCIILIRKPLDAVASLVQYYDGNQTPAMAFREYYRFYEGIVGVRSGFLLVPFEVATRDFGRVIRALNEKFGTTFREFEHTKEVEERIFELVDKTGAARGTADSPQGEAYSPKQPSDELQKRADEQRSLKQLIQNSVSPNVVARCTRIYERLVSDADVRPDV